MAATKLTLDECWEKLVPGFKLLLEYNQTEAHGSTVMSTDSYMKLYTCVYDYCTQAGKPPAAPYGSQHANGAQINGLDLYQRVRAFVKTHCKTLAEELDAFSGDTLLDRYRCRWESYLYSRKVLSNICNYLNRNCVQRAREDHQSDVHEIHKMALNEWRTVVVMQLREKLISAAFGLVERERNGESIVTALVKALTSSLVLLGQPGKPSTSILPPHRADAPPVELNTFEELFEKAFLERTAQYYQAESDTFLDGHSLVDYLKHVNRRVEQEEERVEKYLHESTSGKLVSVCNQALIARHLGRINAEISPLLTSERTEDLQRMYKLLRRIDAGVGELRKRLEEHIIHQGRLAVEGCGEIGAANEDAKRYIDALLAVHAKFRELVKRAFDEDACFVESLDRACRTYINSNSFTQGSRSSRSPEMLAKCCDMLLKKSAKNPAEEQLEQQLVELMVIFHYLDDKDVFEKFYKKLLASRLVNDKSASSDAEESMLSKLKAACGAEYTSKLQRMFQDMETNKQINVKFREHLAVSGGLEVDFNVRVLTTTCWPYNTGIPLNVPRVLAHCMERFTTYYSKAHEGRKLKWLYQLCKGEIIMLYTKKQRILEANTIQMAILLAFNGGVEGLTLENFQELTGVELPTLENQLSLLVKTRLMTLEDETYRLNEKYNHKKVRIRIDQPIKAEQKAESESTHKQAEDDRKFVIQACIVRVMKTRRTLSHQQLMTETLEQLESRFKPKVAAIKRNIEALIEQEYLRRHEDSRDVYDYVA